MKTSIVKIRISTDFYKKGSSVVMSRTIFPLKKNSDIGAYHFVKEDINNCAQSFIESIENFNETENGYFDLIVKYYEGSYEYPSEGYVEYELRKTK